MRDAAAGLCRRTRQQRPQRVSCNPACCESTRPPRPASRRRTRLRRHSSCSREWLRAQALALPVGPRGGACARRGRASARKPRRAPPRRLGAYSAASRRLPSSYAHDAIRNGTSQSRHTCPPPLHEHRRRRATAAAAGRRRGRSDVAGGARPRCERSHAPRALGDVESPRLQVGNPHINNAYCGVTNSYSVGGTFAACTAACDGTPGCWAIDWAASTSTCYLVTPWASCSYSQGQSGYAIYFASNATNHVWPSARRRPPPPPLPPPPPAEPPAPRAGVEPRRQQLLLPKHRAGERRHHVRGVHRAVRRDRRLLGRRLCGHRHPRVLADHRVRVHDERQLDGEHRRLRAPACPLVAHGAPRRRRAVPHASVAAASAAGTASHVRRWLAPCSAAPSATPSADR